MTLYISKFFLIHLKVYDIICIDLIIIFLITVFTQQIETNFVPLCRKKWWKAHRLYSCNLLGSSSGYSSSRCPESSDFAMGSEKLSMASQCTVPATTFNLWARTPSHWCLKIKINNTNLYNWPKHTLLQQVTL